MPIPDDEKFQRRADDRDKIFNTRLVALEQRAAGLSGEVARLSADVGIVKLEQTHLKELFDSRLRVIEQGQAMQMVALESIKKDIISMGDGPERTPSGRLLLQSIGELSAVVEVDKARLADHDAKHAEISKWQNEVNGALRIGQWIGWAGIAALFLFTLRALGVIK